MSANKSEGHDGISELNSIEWNCVCAVGGAALSLDFCDLTCDDKSVVHVAGTNTSAAISSCCIHDCSGFGVTVLDGATATLEHNRIYANTGACVHIEDEGTKVMLRANRIYDGKQQGVFINDKAKATLENNEIHSNCRAGVAVGHEGTEALLKGNIIRNGLGAGILVLVKAQVTLENNFITNNDLAGVFLGKAGATFAGNVIMENGQCKMDRNEEDLSVWPEAIRTQYKSPMGIPGVLATYHSSIAMRPASNTIRGNGKAGSNCEQVMLDGTSSSKPFYAMPGGADSLMANFVLQAHGRQ
jgi:hypothetical protein